MPPRRSKRRKQLARHLRLLRSRTAVQLGLTATPKRANNADTYAYFGDPVYTYALKEGINDGFLTPFKVRQIETNLDEYTYEQDDDLLEGAVEEARTYTEADFNRIIEIADREHYRVKVFMDAIDQKQKTLPSKSNYLMVKNAPSNTKYLLAFGIQMVNPSPPLNL